MNMGFAPKANRDQVQEPQTFPCAALTHTKPEINEHNPAGTSARGRSTSAPGALSSLLRTYWR